MAYIANECKTDVKKLTPSVVKRKRENGKTECDWKTDVTWEKSEARHGNVSLEGISHTIA